MKRPKPFYDDCLEALIDLCGTEADHEVYRELQAYHAQETEQPPVKEAVSEADWL